MGWEPIQTFGLIYVTIAILFSTQMRNILLVKHVYRPLWYIPHTRQSSIKFIIILYTLILQSYQLYKIRFTSDCVLLDILYFSFKVKVTYLDINKIRVFYPFLCAYKIVLILCINLKESFIVLK